MLLQITQICFYESDYVTLHSDMNIIRENGAKITLNCRNNSFKQLLSGTCSKSAISSTTWQMLQFN